MNSICIINRENGDILDKSLSVLITEPNVEILIVDNNSQDNSKEVLEKYVGKKVRAWRWEIRSISFNRNFLIKQSKGKYILLLDSDELYQKGSLDYLIKKYELEKDKEYPDNKIIGAVGFDWNYFTNKMEERDTELPPLDAHFTFLLQPCAQSHYGVFPRELFFKHNIWFDEGFGVGWGHEDTDYGYQMFKKGFLFGTIKFKFYHNKYTEHYEKLHTKEFMKVDEHTQYFQNKWRGVSKEYTDYFRRLRGEIV